MIPKNNFQGFNAKAFELRHSGELELAVIPAGQTERGSSKFNIFLGVQQIGKIYQIFPNAFAAMVSYEYGGNIANFEDPKIAANWLVDRYFDWLDGNIQIKKINLGYKVLHENIYIGFLHYSQLYGKWVATSYPDRFSAVCKTQHQSEFESGIEFIINEYLN